MIDEAAIHHVLVVDPYNFPKPGLLRRFLGALTGEGTFELINISLCSKLFIISYCYDAGILVVEGATHQRQRRIMARYTYSLFRITQAQLVI